LEIELPGMKRFALIVILAIACAGAAPAAPRVDHREIPAVFSPEIEYPLIARKHRITGTGIYVVNINAAGNVTAVAVGASTGSPILDGAAIRSLKRWKFKLGSPPRARLPITWSLP
jgi:TonB family protein